jgi:hypothetical protein
MKWSSSAGKFGGFAKLGSGSPQAANLFGGTREAQRAAA